MAIHMEGLGYVAERQHGLGVNQLQFNTSPGGGKPSGASKERKTRKYEP